MNANDQLDLNGSCLSGCNGKDLKYSYTIYMMNSSNQWNLYTNASYFYQTGRAGSDITMLSDIFFEFSYVLVWKIEMIVNLTTFDNLNLIGASSIIIYVNQPPIPGSCDIIPKNGTTSDLFTIFCDQGSDSTEGLYVNYTYYGNEIN